MSQYEAAQKYLAAVPPAISGQGGHNQTFLAACYLLHDFNLSMGDARALLLEYNERCQPPWTDREIEHKLNDASRAAPLRGRGSKGAGQSFGGRRNTETLTYVQARPPEPDGVRYDLNAVPLPKPIPDGARELLKAAFRPGEWVSIHPAYEDEKEIGKEHASDGVAQPLEWWLDKFASKNPSDIFISRKEKSEGLNGIYVAINPLKPNTTRAKVNVADHRHVLVEFDDEALTLEKQWDLIQKSKIPCSAIVSSGGKSLHAWVRVDAADAKEWAERMTILYAHFAKDQKPDPKNKEEARLSRLANCIRGTRRQELLSRQCGAKDWHEWVSKCSPNHTGLPPILKSPEMDAQSWAEPPVLIDGVLHRGAKLILGGDSKSYKTYSLLDMALSVAAGAPWWGRPTVAGRVLYINFELQNWSFQKRKLAIEKARGLSGGTNFDYWGLRGFSASIDELMPKIVREIGDGNYDLIVFDPIYMALGWRDENKAGDISDLLNYMEWLCKSTGAAIVFAHHFSKGNQSSKMAGDRMSGSGVFRRNPDAILTMTAHSDDGCFAVEASLRDLPPVPAWVVRWDWPVFQNAPELDASNLKEAGRPNDYSDSDLVEILNSLEENQKSESQESQQSHNWVEVKKWRTIALDELGISKPTFQRRIARLLREKKIAKKGRGHYRVLKRFTTKTAAVS